MLVFVSGVMLLFAGPAHRDPLLLIHKVSFIVWVVFTGAARARPPSRPAGWHSARRGRRAADGPHSAAPRIRAGRWIALAGALVGGLVLALVLIPDFDVVDGAGRVPRITDG